MKSNRMMSMNVLALAPTKHQASVRSAGQEGVVLYELLAERDMARSHVKLAKEQDGIKHVPFWLGTHDGPTLDATDELILVGSDMDEYPTEFDDEIVCTFSIVRLHGFEDATEVHSSFLFGCRSLTTIDLAPLRNITVVQSSFFLQGCSSLTTIDLTPLRNVTEVQSGFLCGCSSLSAIDLAPLRNVTEVPVYFLQGCSSLTTIDLAPLRNITEVEAGFLSRCSSLTTIDITPLRNVTVVQSYFLQGCSSLATIDLAPLRNVTEVSGGFLQGCNSLTIVDLSPLVNVSKATMDRLLSSLPGH